MAYSVISVIYNPASTGRARQKAEALVRELKAALPKARVRLRATKRRGHAETLAYRTALLTRHALIIAVSGDGGFNEVVNGAMRARAHRRRVTVGLVPAGNANDHYASRHRGDLVKRIVAGDEDAADLIRLSAGRLTRYGHSYVGFGLTPQAGEKLNARRLNLWQEVRIVGAVLLHLKSVKLLVNGDVRHYDSLIFSNVGRMSKVIRVPKYAAHDGKIEVSHLYVRNKLKLVGALAHAAVFGLPAEEQVSEFAFETLRPTAVQIDGEIYRLDTGIRADIAVARDALPTII